MVGIDWRDVGEIAVLRAAFAAFLGFEVGG